MVVKEANNWVEKLNTSSSKHVAGKYFPIENSTIKTYLPEGFKEYTIEKYIATLDSSLTKTEVNNELRRLEGMKNMKGSFYLFFDSYPRSTYTINTMPYLNFNRNDAKTLLSIIKHNNSKITLSSDLNFKKLTAAFTKNANFTMFRSIYQIDNFKTDTRAFSTFYIISANKQTFMINLTTPFEVNFDRYIEKMKF